MFLIIRLTVSADVMKVSSESIVPILTEEPDCDGVCDVFLFLADAWISFIPVTSRIVFAFSGFTPEAAIIFIRLSLIRFSSFRVSIPSKAVGAQPEVKR